MIYQCRKRHLPSVVATFITTDIINFKHDSERRRFVTFKKMYIVHEHNLHDCLCKNEEHLKASSSMSDRWS